MESPGSKRAEDIFEFEKLFRGQAVSPARVAECSGSREWRLVQPALFRSPDDPGFFPLLAGPEFFHA
jgi:hypothetical protein